MKKKHVVLVVDDSPTVRRLVTLALSRAGYEVITAENGEEGLETARKSEPSVILVDFVMPKMNGFEFCKNIRADSRLCHIPIVLITSKGRDVGKGFEENFGISHYLQKPFKPETLMDILTHVLSDDETDPRSAPDVPSEESPPSASPQTGDEKAPREVHCPNPGNDNVHANTAVWENISKELTALLKSAVIQILKESGPVQSGGQVLSGEIAYVSVASILKFADMSGMSGRLSVLTDSLNAELHLEDGQVLFACMHRPGCRTPLEELILKDRTSPAAEILSCFTEAGSNSLTAAGLLLERGLITEEELARYCRHLSEDAVNEALSATSGRFSIEDVPLPLVLRRMKLEKKQPV